MALLMELNSLLIPWVESIDISSAVLFVAFDESLCVAGTTMLVVAGADCRLVLLGRRQHVVLLQGTGRTRSGVGR